MGGSGSKSKKRNTDRTRLVNDAVRKKDQLLKVQNDARANKEEYKKSQKAARRRQQELLKKQQDGRNQQVRKQQQLLKLRKQQEQARREKSLNERLAKLTWCWINLPIICLIRFWHNVAVGVKRNERAC